MPPKQIVLKRAVNWNEDYGYLAESGFKHSKNTGQFNERIIVRDRAQVIEFTGMPGDWDQRGRDADMQFMEMQDVSGSSRSTLLPPGKGKTATNELSLVLGLVAGFTLLYCLVCCIIDNTDAIKRWVNHIPSVEYSDQTKKKRLNKGNDMLTLITSPTPTTSAGSMKRKPSTLSTAGKKSKKSSKSRSSSKFAVAQSKASSSSSISSRASSKK